MGVSEGLFCEALGEVFDEAEGFQFGGAAGEGFGFGVLGEGVVFAGEAGGGFAQFVELFFEGGDFGVLCGGAGGVPGGFA